YSASGSITYTLQVGSKRQETVLRKKLFPEPDLAKTTMLAFSNCLLLKGLIIIRPPLEWTPNITPLSILMSLPVNGKKVAAEPVPNKRLRINKLFPSGRQLSKPI